MVTPIGQALDEGKGVSVRYNFDKGTQDQGLGKNGMEGSKGEGGWE